MEDSAVMVRICVCAPQVPADKRRRAEVLAAEVANIRSRIAVLRSSYGDDPAAANLII